MFWLIARGKRTIKAADERPISQLYTIIGSQLTRVCPETDWIVGSVFTVQPQADFFFSFAAKVANMFTITICKCLLECVCVCVWFCLPADKCANVRMCAAAVDAYLLVHFHVQPVGHFIILQSKQIDCQQIGIRSSSSSSCNCESANWMRHCQS